MKKYYSILIFCIIGILEVHACNCPIVKDLEKIQQYELKNSECIFIGEVINVDSENELFEVRVFESFNGDGIGNIYVGTYDSQCGPKVDEKGRWLIYGNFGTDSELIVNSCGLTRSFENPENNISVPIDIAPAPVKDKYESWRAEWNKKARKALEIEISRLRETTE